MGSFIETNDTLQITLEQGFPAELNLDAHLKKPFAAEDFKGRVFTFRDKPAIRIYHAPPVRNFFAQNFGEAWLYWGLVNILSVEHDMIKKTTSGTYEILYLYTPEEMKMASRIIGGPNSHVKDYFDKN